MTTLTEAQRLVRAQREPAITTEAAREREREILSTHYPALIDPALDAEIRSRFPVRLKPEDMRAGNGRW